MQRPLGQSGIALSAVGLGLVDFAAGPGFIARRLFAPLDQPAKTAVVAAALAGGINWFDTAEMYGFGASERALAMALKTLGVAPDAVAIATKWFPLGRTAGHIARSIDARLQALGGFPIGLYMVHNPLGLSTTIAEMRAMAALQQRGLIRAVGVSNFSAAAMRRAHRTLAAQGLPLAVNQVRLNLLDRRVERNGVLETARELGISLMAYSPLAKGFLSGRYHREPALLAAQGLRRRLMMPQNLARTAPDRSPRARCHRAWRQPRAGGAGVGTAALRRTRARGGGRHAAGADRRSGRRHDPAARRGRTRLAQRTRGPRAGLSQRTAPAVSGRLESTATATARGQHEHRNRILRDVKLQAECPPCEGSLAAARRHRHPSDRRRARHL